MQFVNERTSLPIRQASAGGNQGLPEPTTDEAVCSQTSCSNAEKGLVESANGASDCWGT